MIGIIGVGMISGCFLNVCMMLLTRHIEGDRGYKQQWFYYFIGIELSMVWASIFCYRQYGVSFMTWMYMSFWCVLVLLTLIDLKFMILPTSVIVVGSGIGIVFKTSLSLMLYDWFYLWDSIVAGILGYVFFYLVYMTFLKLKKKEGMGFGDVRMMGLLGIYVGTEKIVIMLLIASFMALIVGGILYMIRKKSEAYPFGPWLCSATMIMLLWGEQIMQIYKRMLGV